jgi:hypothetical protein
LFGRPGNYRFAKIQELVSGEKEGIAPIVKGIRKLT